MHFNKTRRREHAIADIIVRISSAFFWLLLLFGFDSTRGALLTLAAALIHELGHIIALFILGYADGVPLPRMPGFSIGIRSTMSYKDDIAVSAAGPAANLLTAVLLLPLGSHGEEMILISILTALSNLLPVRGYDGYRMLSSIIALSGREGGICRLPDILSFATATLAVILSLYGIYAFDAGYWIFGIFFVFLLGEVKKTFG